MHGLRRLIVLALFVLVAAFAGLSLAAPAQAISPEFRAYWVDASGPGLYNPQQIDKLVSDVKAANLNAIVVEVVREGDCFCNKAVMPRTEAPIDPLPFDPLQTLIDKAHAQGIEVHAWINATPMWNSPTPPKASNHVFNTHGPSKTGYDNWVMLRSDGANRGGSVYYLDPGHPAAADYIVSMYTSIVANYQVDGINLDRIRYPDYNLGTNIASWGYNPAAVALFQAATGRADTPAPTDPQWTQWRRDRITDIVRRVYLESYAVRPSVRVSADTIAYWNGPQSAGGWTNTPTYAQVLQDWRGWMQEGILDLNIPMNYKAEDETTEPNNQRRMYTEWNEFAKDNQYGRQAAIGAGPYTNTISGSITQVRKAEAPSAKGNRSVGWIGYAYHAADRLAYQGMRSADVSRAELTRALTQPSTYDPITPPVFASPATVPTMPWKAQPTTGHLKGTLRAVDGTPFDRVRVELYDATTKALVAARSTDASGWFGFVDLKPGRYDVLLGGARAGSPPLTTVDVVAGKIATLDLSLCPNLVPTGLFCVQYYQGETLGAPSVYATMEPTISHDWGAGRPAPRVGADGFSARWEGSFSFEAATYTFSATADDGVRVWIDDDPTPLIDGWKVQGPTAYQASLRLSAGYHKVRMEYFERTGGAVARLSWAPNCYDLALSHSGHGADPTASPTKSAACAATGSYVDGEQITLTASPLAGEGVLGWTGTNDDSSTATTNSLTMPASDRAVTVTYSTVVAVPQMALLPQPVRVVDTRVDSGYLGAGEPLQGMSSPHCYQLTGRAGVPLDATAVVINLTAVGYKADGWIAAYPYDPNSTAEPTTSSLNFDTQENAIANSAIVALGQGQLCLTASSYTNAIVDVTGYLVGTPEDQVKLLAAPQRVVDTRPGLPYQGSGTPLQGYTSHSRFKLAGQAGSGVPAGATAVLVNLTAVGYKADGWLSAYPACTPRPDTSNVNFDTVENAIAGYAIVRLGSASATDPTCEDAIDVTGAQGTNVIVDVTGYLVQVTSPQIVLLDSPKRLVDTRPNLPYQGSGSPLSSNPASPRPFVMAGQGGAGGVPSTAKGVIANLTAVGYRADGWIAAYPTGGAIPVTSSVNFDLDENAIANTAILRLGTGGQVSLVACAQTNAIIDVSAYLAR